VKQTKIGLNTCTALACDFNRKYMLHILHDICYQVVNTGTNADVVAKFMEPWHRNHASLAILSLI